jgi:hypothetical protein
MFGMDTRYPRYVERRSTRPRRFATSDERYLSAEDAVGGRFSRTTPEPPDAADDEVARRDAALVEHRYCGKGRSSGRRDVPVEGPCRR